jgi:type II secretory pathway component GspD/PulD (secretin)
VDDPAIYAQTKVVQLSKVAASEIEPFVRSRLSRFGSVQINDALNLLIITDREPKLSDLERLVKRLDEMGRDNFLRLETEVIPLKFAKPSALVGYAQKRLSIDGTVEADDDRGQIILTDVRSKIDSFKTIIESLDVMQKQIILEAKVVEAKRGRSQDVGIDWSRLLESAFGRAEAGYSRRTNEYNYENTNPPYSSVSGQKNTATDRLRAWSATWADELGNVLHILQRDGTVNLLAEPRVVVINNRTGSFRVDTPEGPSRLQSIFLSATPTVGASDWMTLNVGVSVSSRFATGPVEPETREQASEQSLNSTVVLRNNETYVVSGITKRIQEKSVKRVPILGRALPFLFSRTVSEDFTYDVAIFLTPRLATEEVLKTGTIQGSK